jgi:hypothetical protein
MRGSRETKNDFDSRKTASIARFVAAFCGFSFRIQARREVLTKI